MENKENVSDSDSNSSSSWIFINQESLTIREEIEDVKLPKEDSDIESESDGISVISESDAFNEEKCMETCDDFMDYTEYDAINRTRIVCAKSNFPQSEDIVSIWGMLSCIICGCLCAFVTLQGHEYLKKADFESALLDQVIDSTVGCVNTFTIHKMHYSNFDVKECVLTIIDDIRYGDSVEEAIKHVNFSKTRTIPFNFETKNDLGKKCKNSIKKDKCKKKNISNKDKESKNMKATCKLKVKKGSFKKIKNKEIVTGEWYLDLHKARNEIRSREHVGDWVFDRAYIRNKKRNSALWYFSYMKMREKYRFKSLKKDNT